MIHTILRKMNMFYVSTIRKRTIDRFVIYRKRGEYSYIKVDERKLEGLSIKEDIEYVYEKMIKEQVEKNKKFNTSEEVSDYISMI